MINIIVYVLPFIFTFDKDVSIRGELIDSRMVMNSYLAKDNRAIRGGEWYRFFTANFVHGDIFHLLFNMLAFFSLSASWINYLNAFLGGKISDIALGSTIIPIYLICGWAGYYLSYKRSKLPSVGSSAAIFGLWGAVTIFDVFSGNINQIFSSLINIAIIYYITKMTGMIDNNAHIGGFVAGLLIGLGSLMSIIAFGVVRV